jgi:hypothetical protein
MAATESKMLELGTRAPDFQFVDSRPGRGTATGADLRAACDALLSGADISKNQKPSIGCNIKWKK